MSTARSVVHKMGEIKNLPVYWDEIKNKEAQKNVFDVFFTGTEGVGPSRLTSTIELRDRGDWQTMLVICANLSFVDYIVQNQPTTDAGVYRVFEYETKEIDPENPGPGRLTAMEASRITQELEHNYGVMGMKYAIMLGRAPHDIDEFTRDTVAAFGAKVGEQQAERFWIATCGTLLAGAALANQLGATLDVPALEQFLLAEFELNRGRKVSEATTGGTEINTEEALTAFLKAHTGDTIFTDIAPNGKGRPTQPIVIFAPRLDSGRGINVQWATKDRVLRISRRALRDYLNAKSIPPQSILRGLKDHFGMVLRMGTLASGTPYRAGQETLLTLPIAAGSELEKQMMAHSTSIGGIANHKPRPDKRPKHHHRY